MKLLKTLGILLWLAAAVALILIGHGIRGPVGLLVMLLGLAGLLALLWLYNRRFTKAERLEKKRRGKEGGANG